MRILIVDDEPFIRDTLKDALEDEGFSVTTAANGAEALEHLGRLTEVCAVVLDLMMPVMDGLELLEAMRASPRLSHIPVIVATAEPGRAPADVVTLKKPLNLNTLVERVASSCGGCKSKS